MIFALTVSLTSVITAQRVISGMIKDVKGEPLVGATVYESGKSDQGTITDASGHFILNTGTNAKKLIVSYIGYETLEVLLTSINEYQISLKESSQTLNEVIIVGYGNTNKKILTDNVAKLGAKDISNISVSNFQATMSGKAAGVRINQTNGKVDGAMNIRIRGTSSISAGGQPLYVLDGMPLINVNESNNGAPMNPLLSLSPSEIESIDILKDASSAAIYGARGANGVVLITTKKGKAGKTNISINMSSGVSSPTRLVTWLNAEQYKTLFTEAAINTLGEEDGTKEVEGLFDYLANGTDWKNNNTGTDWNKLAFRDGSQFDTDVSISGGDAKTQYFVGGAINKTKGILLGNDLQKLSARINLKHQVNNKLSAGMNLGVSKTTVERVDNDNSFTTPLQAIAQSPLSPAYNEDGTPNANTLYPNFLLEDLYANYTTNLRRVTGKLFGEYRISQSFKFNSDLGYDLSYQTEEQYRGKLTPFMSTNGYAYNSSATSENYLWSNYFTFSQAITENLQLNIVAGQEFNNSDRTFTSVTGTQFPSDDFQTVSSAAEITAGKGSEEIYTFLSYFGRATINLKEKYIFKASLRRDGSSRFGAKNRYGYFPAVSAAWIISEEGFMKNRIGVLSFLKLRASYGQLGNSEIGNFASRTLFNGANYNKIAGITFTQPGNDNLTWEKSSQLDIGLDFGFLKDRIFGELDVYRKNTEGLLFKVPLPGSSGQTEISKNIGALASKGIEIVLNAKILMNSPLQWTSGFNIAKNTNKITALPNNNADIIYEVNAMKVGQPVGSFFTPEFAGADPSNGDALFYKNGKGTETTADYSEAERVIAGNPQPTWISGLTNELSFKGLVLSCTFVGEWGASIYNHGGRFQSASADYFDNQTIDQMDRWQKPGDITQVPQARLYGANGTQKSSRYLQKADFIRLRNITLSYSLPQSLLKKTGISSLRVFASGVNLLTFTDFAGYDPEAREDASSSSIDSGSSFYSAPQAKTTSVGINLNF